MNKLFLPIAFFCFAARIYAGSARWATKPTSGDWNTAANWTPQTVPNSETDVATFGKSNVTNLSITNADVALNSAIFDSGQLQTDPEFVHYALHNYAQTLTLSTLASLQLNPVNLVPGAIAHGWKPIYMFNSYHDHPTAYHQLVRMVCLLESKGLTLGTDYQYLTVPGNNHAFEYWGGWDHISTSPRHSVQDDVIAFLKTQAHLP
jgi:hypothetical protein